MNAVIAALLVAAIVIAGLLAFAYDRYGRDKGQHASGQRPVERGEG